MLVLNNNLRLPYIRRNNLCFMLHDTNEMIGIARNSKVALFENVFLEGVQNFVLISTLLLLARTLPNTTPPKAIVRVTDPIINFSKKFINFDNYYFQIGLSSAFFNIYINNSGCSSNGKKKITIY